MQMYISSKSIVDVVGPQSINPEDRATFIVHRSLLSMKILQTLFTVVHFE